MLVPMKRMTIVALKTDEEAILCALRQTQAIQVIPQEYEPGYVKAATGESLTEEKLKRLNDASKALSAVAKKPSMLTPKPEVERDAFLKLTDSDEPMKLCLEIERLRDAINKCEADIKAANTALSSMSLFKSVNNIKIEDIVSTKHTIVMGGTVPLKFVDELMSSDNIVVTKIDQDTKNASVIVAFHKSAESVASPRLRELGFSAYAFNNMTGTPQHAYTRLEEQLASLKKHHSRLNDELAALGDRRTEVMTAADAYAAELELEMAREDILKSDSAFLLEGWARADEAMKVDAAVKSVTDAYYIDARDPADDEIPPSVVQNNKFNKPFEAITNLYSRPDPRGIDATPFMAPFYLLFFAMMLSDSGYGLLLFLGGLLFLKLKKPTGVMESLTQVITLGGLATVIIGPFIGTFFGMSFNTLFFGTTEGPFPLLMDPLGDAMMMLILCCGLGVAHMIFGLCVKMYMSIKRGDTATAMFDCLSWIFLIVGLIGLLAVPDFGAPFAIIALVGAFMIILFAGRAKKGIKRLTKGLGSLYDITGYMSDIVSYARIFAMGLVTGAMGEVFNTLGGMLAGSFGGIMKIVGILAAIIVLVVLHGFSLFMNTLGSFAHTARLQYIEFYGKFYEPGGREFRPLGYYPKNVVIK